MFSKTGKLHFGYNCFNHVKVLQKLGHMVLQRGYAVYIAAEYNLYFHSHKSTLGLDKCCNAFEFVSAEAFLLITLLQNGQLQSFPSCRNVSADIKLTTAP